MTILIRTLQFILSLSFLVMIHELGHFTFARIFGVRVHKFYMFFNPRRSILRAKKINGKWQLKFFAENVLENQKVAMDAQGNPLLWEDDPDPKIRRKYEKKEPLTSEEWDEIEEKFNFGRKITRRQGHPKFTIIEPEDLPLLADDDWRKYPEHTEWGIGWLPLGGYCAIAGMVDETTTADQLGSTPHPWEYRAKPTWQRLPIITGGVLVNFIGALVIYAAVFHHWGQDYMPLESATYGMHYSEPMLSEGFVQGDKIIRIGDRVPDNRADLVNWMVVDGVHDVQVLRGQDTVNLTLSEGFERKIIADQGSVFCDFRFPFVVGDLVPEGPAARALMMAGDSVVAIGGKECYIYQDIVAELAKHACDSVDVTYFRGDEIHTVRVFLGDEAKLGVYPKGPNEFLEVKHIDYSFWEAIPAGIRYGWETLANYVKQFRLVFTKEGAQSLGGFAAIGSLFAPVWDWHSFWLMTAFLSIILAFMNIIPIPGLDGGHMLFLLWEMITGKKPGEKFIEVANTIGFYLLLALLIYANGNDIIKLFMK